MKDLHSIFQKAFTKRHKFFADNQNTCFRLFNSTADGIEGITLDIYGEYLLGQSYHRSVQSLESKAALIVIDLCEKMGKKIEGVLWKMRWKSNALQQEAMSRLLWGKLPPQKHVVVHNGMLLYCDLVERQNTGIFMDMREVRDDLVGFYPKFHSMLNLFSYTAAFAIHARLKGVAQCINVDSSKSAQLWAKENYLLNGLKVDERDFIVGDVDEWLKIFLKKKKLFSFIVYDPPTFSHSKGSHYSVRKDFQRHCDVISELASGGYVLTALNTISISKQEYFSYHPKQWDLVFFKNEAMDFRFPQKPYLKAALWKVP